MMQPNLQFVHRAAAAFGMALAANCACAFTYMDSTSPGLGTLLMAWWYRF